MDKVLEPTEEKVSAQDIAEKIIKFQEEEISATSPSATEQDYFKFPHNTLADTIIKGVNAPISQPRPPTPTQEDLMRNQVAEPLGQYLFQINMFEELEFQIDNAKFKITDANNILKKLTKTTGINTVKLLMLLWADLFQKGFSTTLAHISLRDYAAALGVNDLKEVRQKIILAIDYLKHIEFKIKLKKGVTLTSSIYGGNQIEQIITTGDSPKAEIKNGEIYFQFNSVIIDVFKQNPKQFLYLPNAILALNPNSKFDFMIFYVMHRHKRLNTTKNNEDIISVKEIYNFSVTIPRYENIKKSGKIDQQIIAPFEKSLDSFSKYFSWHYTEDTAPPFVHFEDFLKAKIVVEWNAEAPGIDKIRQGRIRQAKKKAKQKREKLPPGDKSSKD